MEEKYIRISDYVFLFIIIYFSADTLLFGTNSDSRFIKFGYVVSLTCFVSLTISLRNNLNRICAQRSFIYIGGMIICCLLSMLVNYDFNYGYFLKIFLLLFAILYINKYPLAEFSIIFTNVILIVCIFSLIGYIIMILNNGILPTPFITINTYDRGFYNLGFAISPNYTRQIRNWSFFREPGVFQIYVIIALFFHLTYTNKFSILKILIYIVTVFTTLSTTGYIALIGIFAIIILRNNTFTKKKKMLLICLIVIIISYIAIYTNLLSFDVNYQRQSVLGKFYDLQRGTTISRIGSFYGNIQLFLKSPLFGIGLGGIDRDFLTIITQKYYVNAAANTNMLLIQFSAHGFIYGCLWTLGMYFLTGQIVGGLERAIIIILGYN